MAGKSTDDIEHIPDGNLQKSFLKTYIAKHESRYEGLSDVCVTTLAILKTHPSSPTPDFDVEKLDEEAFREVREKVLEEMSNVELSDDELRAYLAQHGELEDEDTIFLLGPAPKPEPAKQSGFKWLRSALTRKKDEPKETAEPAEKSKGWNMIRRVRESLSKDYNSFKATILKFLKGKRRLSGPRYNTPILPEDIATVEIENMTREVQIIQFCLLAYKERIKAFEARFKFLKIHESCKALVRMNEKCSKNLKDEMRKLLTFLVSADSMIVEMEERFRQKQVFLDCSNRYERQKEAEATKKRGFFKSGGSSKRDKTPPKGKRKNVKEDKKQLLRGSPSPKRTKDEDDSDDDEKDVERRFRDTSVSDDDDDME